MNLKKPIRKAVFPVAGLGTRFLPATKVLPKEMLPLVDRPLIQRAVEEAQDAGIEEFIFVTGRGKSLITEHFDFQPELLQALRDKKQTDLIEKLRRCDLESGRLTTTLQQLPLGLGHAVWCARNLVGNEPFALILTDVMILGQNGVKDMVDAYHEHGGNIIASAHVPRPDTKKYGILDVDNAHQAVSPIRAMVEKPAPEQAPSTLSIVGRYILQPEIFTILEQQKAGAGGEIQLTDAMQTLLKSQPFTSVQLQSPYFDCGNHIGFIEANIAFALADPDFSVEIKQILKKYIADIA